LCINTPNFVKIGHTVAEDRDFCFFNMAAAAILDFQKFKKKFNGGSAARGQCASPCQILSKSVERLQRYGDLTVFIKMAAVRHPGFVGRLLGPPTMTNWWCLSLCQIRLKSMEWFRQHETVNILPVWLENFYSRSKIGVFGGFSPNMGCSINETPKRHILARVHVV